MTSNAIYPITNPQIITPSDTSKIQYNSKSVRADGIILNGASSPVNVAVADKDGNSVVLTLATDVVHPISTDQVFSTGTTATKVVVGIKD